MALGDARKILLAHGGGGRVMNRLIRETILPRIRSGAADETEAGRALMDAAEVRIGSDGGVLCFTTDSYVVQPLRFPGGDIGTLAVCGTMNDLAAAGARPVALSLSLILEEGLPLETLEAVLDSVGRTAAALDVPVVTGDTKVVEVEAADGLFINTAGVGVKLPDADLGFDRVQPGDAVIVTGTLGDHGITILSRRKGMTFQTPLASDCAALWPLVERLIEAVGPGIRFMRDPTRGGLAAVLNELAAGTGCDVEIEEARLPVKPVVQAAAEMLGLDVLNVANEGKMVLVVAPEAVDRVLEVCRGDSLGRDAAVIGRIGPRQDGGGGAEPTGTGSGLVELVTRIGGRRVVQMPYGRDLPRIC